MKKHFLALAVAVSCIALSANAFNLSGKMKLHPESSPDLKPVEMEIPVTPAKAPASATAEGEAAEIYYSLANDPYTALSLTSQTPGMQVAMAFQFDPTFLAGLTDSQITGITYYTGTQTNERINKITKAYVFITDDLTSDTYLYTQEVSAPTTAFTRVDVTLDKPFNIPEGKKIYCGVYFNLNSEYNASIVVDYMGHANDLGGWFAYRTSSKSQWKWQNISTSYGFVTVGATIRANGLPENSVSVLAIDGQPVAYQNQPLGFQFILQNNGVNAVDNITVEYGIDNETPVVETFTLSESLAFNQLILGSINDFAAANPTKGSVINLNVKAVNGESNTSQQASGSYKVVIVPEGKGFDRNVVIEEFTSTSCAFCPVGYTAMEQIHEECTDGTVIPVCIHVNSPGRDPLTSASYNSVYNRYCTGGVPSTIVNRIYDQYPFYDELMELANEIKQLPAIATVSGVASFEEGTRNLTISTTTSFAFDYTDGNQNLILSYGITENDLGPYTQNNGYAGEPDSYPGDWQNQPSSVELVYNDVARQLDKFTGITGSVPAEISAGSEYSYSHTLSVLNAVNDLSKINIVVYILNRNTGEIENACVVKNPLDSESGIETTVCNINDAPVEYFNLQGIRVNDPSCGIYIRRQGSEVSKVLVK